MVWGVVSLALEISRGRSRLLGGICQKRLAANVRLQLLGRRDDRWDKRQTDPKASEEAGDRSLESFRVHWESRRPHAGPGTDMGSAKTGADPEPSSLAERWALRQWEARAKAELQMPS